MVVPHHQCHLQQLGRFWYLVHVPYTFTHDVHTDWHDRKSQYNLQEVPVGALVGVALAALVAAEVQGAVVLWSSRHQPRQRSP
jgi:hypothetical protein